MKEVLVGKKVKIKNPFIELQCSGFSSKKSKSKYMLFEIKDTRIIFFQSFAIGIAQRVDG